MSEENDWEKYRRYRYLPLLSLVLVLVSGGMLLKMYLDRPSGQRERQVASFAAALEEIPKRYRGEVSARDLYTSAMRGMMGALRDPYSMYMDPHELNSAAIQTSGEFGGIGVRVSPQNGGAIITELFDGSPAEQAGLEPGDVIVGVNGKGAEGLPFVHFISRIRGKTGTTVTLSVEGEGDEEAEEVEVERRRIDLETVQSRWAEDGIGYVSIGQFDEGSDEAVREAIQQLGEEGEIRALLLDVRGNTGGLMDAAVKISDLFLESGMIAEVESRVKEEEKTFTATPEVIVPASVPIAVLVDGRSASASEVLAGSLQSLERATLIGSRTVGKGAVNRMMPLPDGGGVMLTVAEYTVGPGVVIDGRGLTPDEVVGDVEPPTGTLSAEERDQWLEEYQRVQQEQFDRAVELLNDRLD
ncbi:MAG: S41 family peptidase [Planctomycetota bacterium]